MGMSVSDLNYAFTRMKRMDHDYAEFGVFGSLIFTAKDKKNKAS